MASASRTIQVKFDGTAKGLVAAAEEAARQIDKIDKTTSKTSDKFGKEGEKASKSFGASVKKWFTGDGSKLFGKSGQISGEAFSSGLIGMLKTPILGPLLIAALAAVVAVAMPAIGAIAGGALVAGMGVGMAGLGILFAAKSDAVGAKWSTTMSQLGADMQLLSKPFESTLINTATYFQRTVDKFNPALSKAFSSMAGPTDKFVNDTAHSLEQLIPAIDPITRAYSAVLDALGPALQGAIGAVSTSLSDLASSVEKNPQALAETVTGLGDIVSTALDLITTLNDINTSFSTLTGGVSLVELALGSVSSTIVILDKTFGLMKGTIDGVNALLGRTGKDSDSAGQSMSDAAGKTALLAQGLGETGDQAVHAGKETRTAAQKVQDMKNAAAAAKQKLDDYISSMFALQNMTLGLSGAQISLQSAIDDATQAVTDNGKATDIGTEKGRANKTALDNLAQSANGQTEAMLRSDKGVRAAANAADQSRATFVALAQKMGYSKAQADAMAKSMIAIPEKTETDFKADITDLDAKIRDAKSKLKDPQLTATKRAKLEAEIAQLLAAKKQAQAAIDALHGKTVTVTMKLNSANIQQKVNDQLARAGVVPGRAAGGPVAAGRTYLVGEKGPEILTMGATGGHVTPNHELGGPTYLETHIEIGGEVVRVVRTELKQQNRDLKRTVKAGG